MKIMGGGVDSELPQ
jgi:hypothetical protein